MSQNTNKPAGEKDHGFTLIEILIVVGIIGLIMVIVFLAITGAQKSRRDKARQDAVNRLAAAINQAAVVNNGVPPTPSTTPPSNWSSPSSPTLSITNTPAADTPSTSQILWVAAADPASITIGGNAIAVTCANAWSKGYVITQVENGPALYCVNY